MTEIKRDLYLQKLIDRKENGEIKVITGIRRCGKSYLLFNLYYNYLLQNGVDKDCIIRIALDSPEWEDMLNIQMLNEYIKSKIVLEKMNYVFLDEVQFVDGFAKLLNGLNRYSNLDIYVTGSNSKFLSTDILTEFRGRGDEVRVYPLNYAEFVSAFEGSKEEAWKNYYTYGGLPQILARKKDELKAKYLRDLFSKVYLADIVERNSLRGDVVMDTLVNILASSVGSLTNPSKLANTFASKGIKVSDKTIGAYIDYLQDAFLVNKAERYDIKGRKYIASPFKYYFTDVGLRNVRLNFRQQEENHIMENIIYNELLVRDFNVDVGIVEYRTKNAEGKQEKVNLEVDFVCNKGSQRFYIQSAFSIPDREKMKQEQNSLVRINDSFKKIIVVKDDIKPWYNEEGILVLGLQQFLLQPESMLL